MRIRIELDHQTIQGMVDEYITHLLYPRNWTRERLKFKAKVDGEWREAVEYRVSYNEIDS